MKKVFVGLLAALSLTLVAAAPVSAAPTKGEVLYQQWLDQTAVAINIDGVVTTYTERQVGVPAFQEMKHAQMTGQVVAQTIYWNCQAGVGCEWQNQNGGGNKETHSVGQRGIGNCWYEPIPYVLNASSASADYGSGYDLRIWISTLPCVGSNVTIYSSHSANFTGVLAWAEDANTFVTIGLF